jgi:hypothetical protein
MSESDKSFTVSDRRHFTPEGRPRDDEPEDATGPAGATPEPRADARAEGSRGVAGPPVDFATFLVGLAAQAGALIEGGAEGASRAESLEAARSIISILEMLKDKTEGRRTREEEALLADLLFQLRLAYVSKTRAGGE